VVDGYASTWNSRDMKAMHALDTEDVEWIDVAASRCSGRTPSDCPLMFERVLRTAAFPTGFKSHKAFNPASGPATPAEGRTRLETAHQRFAEAYRRVAADGRPMATLFGSVRVQDLVRFTELHTRHHTKQMSAKA
jgi:hypothetical protein